MKQKSWWQMENKFSNIEDLKNNGFVDNAGAQIYPYQPEKHGELSVSKIFPHFVEIYSLGVCPNGEVLVTVDQSGQKVAMRLPKSERMTNWGTLIVNTMVQNPDFEQFPCRLKLEYNTFLNDYVAVLLLPETE